MNNIDILEELVSAYKDCFVENYNEMIVDVGMRYKDIQAISTLIAENKEKDEEIKNQDKTIDRLVKEQEEREKYTHQLESENKELKEKNKSLEQENSFLKMMYRGTDEFKAIDNLTKEE